MQAAPRQEFRGHIIGQFEYAHPVQIILHSTILFSGYSTIPCAPAAFKRGMIERTTSSSMIVFTAIHAGSLSVETVGFLSAGSTASTAARCSLRTFSMMPTFVYAAIAPESRRKILEIFSDFHVSDAAA